MDKSGANKAAIDQIIDNKDVSIVVRQVKCINDIVRANALPDRCSDSSYFDQPEMSWPALRYAYDPQGQLMIEAGEDMSFAGQFYALAGQLRPV